MNDDELDKMSIDKKFVEELCKLSGTNYDSVDDLSKEELEDLLDALKNKLTIKDAIPQELLAQFDMSAFGEQFADADVENDGGSGDVDIDRDDDTMQTFADSDEQDKPTVLLIDDLGVILYQLNLAFRKLNMVTYTAREIFDALDKFKKKKFSWVVMDLFIPTDREGFILLAEIKKIIKLKRLKTKIIVITASSKKEYRQLCLAKGADYFFEKSSGWQTLLTKTCFDKSKL